MDAASDYEARKKREKQEEMKQEAMNDAGAGRQPNPRAGGVGPSGGGGGDGLSREETVRYINKNEYPDHPVHDE